MTMPAGKRLSYHIGCMKSLRNLPDQVALRFMALVERHMSAPSRNRLKLEPLEGAKESALKSLRIDKRYSAIAFAAGRDIMFVQVNEHDTACLWAAGRRVKLDPITNRVRVIAQGDRTTVPVLGSAVSDRYLFMDVADERLRALGVLEEEFPALRSIATLEALEASEAWFDPLTYQVLYAVALGYTDDEIQALTGIAEDPDADLHSMALSFDQLIVTEESRQTIFIPMANEDLRRVFDAELNGRGIFLHPAQRMVAYKDYNGPALVRGGAGTGKTVVAMHRAKHLADQIKNDPSRRGERVLLTTFTTDLAKDIEARLRMLCPEHLDAWPPRIEVTNLDLWVADFLKRKNYGRKIVFFGEARDRLDQLWQEVFANHALPEGISEAFIKAEWTQVVQARGLTDQRTYLRVLRTGRGTPLDRHQRTALWPIFEDYRTRLILQQIAEPDDAYRDAIEILSAEASDTPYAAVIVDEAQDMSEQALRLIRAIVPETPNQDHNSIFIVGDAHQRIYGRRASMSACGIKIRGRSRRLCLNYRNTQKIGAWAISLLEGTVADDLDGGTEIPQDYIGLSHGAEPELVEYISDAEELSSIANWIHGLSSNKVQLSDIAVLCACRVDVKRVSDALRISGIHNTILQAETDEKRRPGVRVMTMHRAKGLEFFAVAIPFLSTTSFPPGDALTSAADATDWEGIITKYRALLYVAATRAKNVLRISWSGEPTRLMRL